MPDQKFDRQMFIAAGLMAEDGQSVDADKLLAFISGSGKLSKALSETVTAQVADEREMRCQSTVNAINKLLADAIASDTIKSDDVLHIGVKRSTEFDAGVGVYIKREVTRSGDANNSRQSDVTGRVLSELGIVGFRRADGVTATSAAGVLDAESIPHYFSKTQTPCSPTCKHRGHGDQASGEMPRHLERLASAGWLCVMTDGTTEPLAYLQTRQRSVSRSLAFPALANAFSVSLANMGKTICTVDDVDDVDCDVCGDRDDDCDACHTPAPAPKSKRSRK